MKIIFEKKDLVKAINSVIYGTSSKRDTILEGILITTNNNEVTFKTYNEEISIEYKFNANVLVPGKALIQSYTFSEVIRKLPEKEITLFIDEDKLCNIECQSSKYKLATMDADAFPNIPDVDSKEGISLDQKTLKNLIKQTIFSVGNDEKRKLYTGCLFDCMKDKLNVVAMDGSRLALRSANIICDKEFQVVIPGKTLNEVSRILEDNFDEVKINFSENQCVFIINECKLTTKLLSGTFFAYNDIYQKAFLTKIIINKNVLQECIERIMIISSSNLSKEKRDVVTLNILLDKLILSSSSAVGIAKEEIEIQGEGSENKLSYNPKFFIDVLRNIEDEEIVIEFSTSKAPTLIHSVEEGNYKYVILPTNIRG